MSKAVMLSIQPRWCELIANGDKTIEIRKTRPKIKTPFKVYIYCTKPRFEHEDYFALVGKPGFYGGEKVIGEFVCDSITRVAKIGYNGIGGEPIYKLAGYENWGYPIDPILKKACLTEEAIEAYLNGCPGVAWHISALKIYDKPKEISEFKKHNRECYFDNLGMATPKCSECTKCNLTKPPQSWCYVEVLQT